MQLLSTMDSCCQQCSWLVWQEQTQSDSYSAETYNSHQWYSTLSTDGPTWDVVLKPLVEAEDAVLEVTSKSCGAWLGIGWIQDRNRCWRQSQVASLLIWLSQNPQLYSFSPMRSSVKGKPHTHCGGGYHTGGGSGIGTQVMITVHSSPGRIARITDTFQGIKEKHALVDAKLQLNTYVSMADDYIVVPRQESKGDMSEETCEPKSTDKLDTTLSTEISSDAIKDISKSDSSASDVTIKMETPSAGDMTVDPNLTQNETVPDSDITVDPNQSIGDPPKKGDGDIDGTNTTTEISTPPWWK